MLDYKFKRFIFNIKQKGDDIVVEMPALYMDDMPCDYAWTLKLENVAD